MARRIGRKGLEKHTGREVSFQRGEFSFQGRLYLTASDGSHDATLKDEDSKYSIVPVGPKVPWDDVVTLGQRNRMHDNWDVFLQEGDQITIRERTYKVQTV